ncbi:protein of unknown function [Pararobbsia alpina]
MPINLETSLLGARPEGELLPVGSLCFFVIKWPGFIVDGT